MMKVEATFDRFSSRADGSFGLSFSTQEMGMEGLAQLQDSIRKFGWLVFSENEIQDEEIPKDDAIEAKTPSQRLRGVLYRVWEQNGKVGTFEAFYRIQMEGLIEWAKKKLD